MVSEMVDAGSGDAPYVRQSPGNLSYETAMMEKVLAKGYATGVLSSRRLARKLKEDVAIRVLAVGNRPQNRTYCEFQHRYRADFVTLGCAAWNGSG